MTHFITFGEGSFSIRLAAKRLAKSASKSKAFTTVRHYNLKKLNSLAPNFAITHGNFIRQHPSGLGHFIWKPSLILGAMADLEEEEILVYLDAGCQINYNSFSVRRFSEYLEYAKKHSGLFMQLIDGSFGISDLSESNWTDPKVLKYFNVSIEERTSNQVQAGIIFLKKDEKSLSLLRKWEELCAINQYSLLSPACGSNRHHRSEQSILSILVKRMDFKLIPDETFFFPDWNDGENFPIWAMRNRTGADAFRRNLWDLFLLGLARLERNLSRSLPGHPDGCSQVTK
jgi:hypothetical protein